MCTYSYGSNRSVGRNNRLLLCSFMQCSRSRLKSANAKAEKRCIAYSVFPRWKMPNRLTVPERKWHGDGIPRLPRSLVVLVSTEALVRYRQEPGNFLKGCNIFWSERIPRGILTDCWVVRCVSNPLKHDGNYMYRQLRHYETMRFVHRVCCGFRMILNSCWELESSQQWAIS
jgi:hypothetical protein